MFTLEKKKGKNFIVMNLSDPQLGDDEWAEGHLNRRLLEKTLNDMVERVHPDLITVSGDLTWAGCFHAVDMLGAFLESFGIPWAPVWGNHDNQGGAEIVTKSVAILKKYPHCIYESGDPRLGDGNYVIAVKEDEKYVGSMIMMDSHDRTPYTREDGTEATAWARLYPEQYVWYEEQVHMLEALGCYDSILIMHIPIYAYNHAWNAAFCDGGNPNAISVAESAGGDCWKDGYKDSYGVKYEGIGSFCFEDGAFDVIKRLGHTKHLIAGHDHVNNFMITYEGVRFIYSMKIGAGCYWDPRLNGATVCEIGENGVADVRQEYVDVSAMLSEKN